MTETENTTTTTTRVLCPCGLSTLALDGLCDMCSEEAEEALAIMLSDLDNDDWHMVGDSDGGDPSAWGDPPF